MAATKFTTILKRKDNEKILEIETTGKWTYKTALAIATESLNQDVYELVCVIESSKMYPCEKEKEKILLGEE